MLRLPGAATGVRLSLAAFGLAVLAACGGASATSTGAGDATGPATGAAPGSGTPGTPTPASPSASPSVTASPSASPSAGRSTATGRTIAVTVTGKQVTPAPATVDLAVGETLTVTVTSDHDDQLHAHGFEVEQDVKAGVPTSVVLKGAEPGVYDVEMHHPELKLLSVAVR